MADDKMKIAPNVCSYVDDEHSALTIEIAIPGVQKESIKRDYNIIFIIFNCCK